MSDRCVLNRRTLLASAMSATLVPLGLAGCAERGVDGLAARARPFSASFMLPVAGRVRLDYQDQRNFSLSADAGPGSTIVLNDTVYLYIAPSIATAEAARLLLLGKLRPQDGDPSGEVVLKPVQPGVGDEALPRLPLFDADWPERAAQYQDDRFTVAKLPQLAAGQYAAGTRLRSGMDMRLCGDAVARLIATWPAALARVGLAVIDSSSGARLNGALQPLAHAIVLPRESVIEDLRAR